MALPGGARADPGRALRRRVVARTGGPDHAVGARLLDRGVDPATPHRQDRCQYARKLFPSAGAGVWTRPDERGAGTARPAVVGARPDAGEWHPAPDHRRVFRRHRGGGDSRHASAGPVAARRRRPGGGRRRHRARMAGPRALRLGDGRRVAGARGDQGLHVSDGVVTRDLGDQPVGTGAAHRRGPGASTGRTRIAGRARRAGGGAGARGRVRRLDAARRQRRGAGRAAADVADLLAGGVAGDALRGVVAGRRARRAPHPAVDGEGRRRGAARRQCRPRGLRRLRREPGASDAGRGPARRRLDRRTRLGGQPHPDRRLRARRIRATPGSTARRCASAPPATSTSKRPRTWRWRCTSGRPPPGSAPASPRWPASTGSTSRACAGWRNGRA